MKPQPSYILFILLFLSAFASKAQVTASNYVAPHGVIVHADSRLDILMRKYRNVQLGVIRSGSGFRVQIYNGNDRVKANDIKISFIRRYPNVKTYMTYVQPQFRVKVGDFRTRAEAYKFYVEVSNYFDPCMIVPDIIVINTLQDD
ncbi:MAG: SPOR domain-containing protein [Bacteroidetes bacterium]|nr:SPOR domain-containing protein [Bacteroidota bacterium]